MTGKMKVYELAKQLGVDNQHLLEMAQRLGLDVKNSMCLLGSEEVKSICEYHEKNRVVVKKPAVATKGPVTEKRVGSKVIRRRASLTKTGDLKARPVPEEEAEAETISELPPSEDVVSDEAEVEVEAVEERKERPAPKRVSIKRVRKTVEEEEKAEPTAATEPTEVASPVAAEPPAENVSVEAAPPPEAEQPQVSEVSPTVEVAEQTRPEPKVVPPPLFPAKKKKAVASIIKKVATEQHLAETVGPKLKIERKPKAAPPAEAGGTQAEGASTLRRVKEITVGPAAAEVAKEAGKRRLLRRQSAVFRSADYLKRELVHATKKKKTAAVRPMMKTEITTPAEHKRVVQMKERIVVSEFAKEMGIKAANVIAKLVEMGVMATLNDTIDHETATLIAPEFGYEVKLEVFKEEDYKAIVSETAKDLKPRPPIVTVMGHVDHGKTSLLDAIRKANVAEGEAGGITQHIGAYTVTLPDQRRVTFIDTPGHEAFTSMRARGAKVTDIVVLVVSAIDGVMPQTLESLNHAKAAKVPVVVAINKMDLPQANPDRVRQTLASHELAPEDWGGDTIYVNVSAKTGKGISELLESILVQAEVMELKADYGVPARGTVIESRLDKNRGAMATILVQQGQLSPGDIIVAGTTSGKVRAMTDSFGKPVKKAGPSEPVEVLGLTEVASAGEEIFVAKDDKAARDVTGERLSRIRAAKGEAKPKLSLEEMLADSAEGGKELRLILKTDVMGSTEAIRAAMSALPSDKVKVKILHTAVGGISESDVTLAMASRAVIVGFNVRPDPNARRQAEADRVEIRCFRIIYELLDDVRSLMEGLLDKKVKETVIGHGEVRTVFSIPKIGAIAGSSIMDGKVTRNCFMRLMRDSKVVFEGKVSSLRRFKEDVREVQQGYECGIGLENFNDVKNGDRFEAYLLEEEKATL